jgi:hypothetical protein
VAERVGGDSCEEAVGTTCSGGWVGGRADVRMGGRVGGRVRELMGEWVGTYGRVDWCFS